MNVSTQSTALATQSTAIDTQQQAIAEYQQFRKELDAMRDLIAKDCDDVEVSLFGKVCQRTGLDPFTKQIYAIKRKGRMTIQTGIDGLRLIAERSGKYQGQTEGEWCGEDGVWKKVWLDTKKPPSAARVGIYKDGFREPIYHVARWASYAQLDRDGKPTEMWRKMPDNQLLKCAESGAIRKGFPEATQGLYTEDEMGQADNPEPAPAKRPEPTPEQQAKTQQIRRLMAIAKEKWPSLDDKQRPEILKKFCAKRNLLGSDDSGQPSVRVSSLEQIRAAADALHAWQPEQQASQNSQAPSEVHEAEIVDDEPCLGDQVEAYESQLSQIANPAERETWFVAELARAKVEAGDVFGPAGGPGAWTEQQLQAWHDWLFSRLEASSDENLGW